jgi:ribose transport system permease protein
MLRQKSGPPGLAAPAGAAGSFTVLRFSAIWTALLVLIAVSAILSDEFLSFRNVVDIVHHATLVGLVAIGVTVVLVSGHFDLSVGAIVTLAAVVSIELAPQTPASTLLAVAVPLVLGALVGVANGLVVGALRANSVVATLGMQFVVIGLVLALVSGRHVRVDDASRWFIAIANGELLGIPVPVYLFVAATIAVHVMLTRTALGRHTHAVGGNAEAATLAGIRVPRIVVSAFALSGSLAALAGVIIASRVRNLDPTAGIGYEFAALTAAVLGGARLGGGEGSVLPTFAAALLLAALANTLVLVNAPYSAQLLIQGLLLVLVVGFGAGTGTGRR